MFSSIASLAILLTSSLLIPTRACAPPVNASDAFRIGQDGPADVATLGYSLNHFSLLVNDIDASMHFYNKILGMRHVFTFQATPEYSIHYLSFSQGGSNGTGYQTGEALLAQKSNTMGQLELIYRKNCNSSDHSAIPATTQYVNTFSHVGLIVPDIRSFQRRMEKFKVPILKKTGETSFDDEVRGARAFGFGSDIQAGRMTVMALTAIGFEKFAIVVDPDGNTVEVQPEQV
ncbi:hypothetical protein M409DRAFT_27978 [Zasmidium cellare ATCC 36951]|uniref:VOC domain-containing protein n=1 Tax=Zasmidium cellare ATCC 36951 TaxID=1080233 RepID=A0A6A6C3T0_ZASCE|nr:uncharacterized protein M409DRAFT_27978 [Zasmidium cellare ATCC 36951]KAF2161583.1 hypothetical protein M409DRAFT_27978 [Zasmidium cellare ATCC 36951]